MKRDGVLNLPEGLPARFMDSETGFALLCKFLDIKTRNKQQAIVKIDGVRDALHPRKGALRGMSTSKRLQTQIMTFYSLPDERRKLWQHWQDMLNESRFTVPSFEYQAFKNYGSEFLEQKFDETHVRESLLDFPGVAESVSDLPEWQHPALAAWLTLRSDLLGWKTLPSSRQDAVALATFAVATILDDVRFLQWAGNRTEILTGEYAFALDKSLRDAMTTPMRKKKSLQIIEDKIGTIIRTWNETCTDIVNLASALGGDHPRPDILDDLIKLIHVLEDLREPLIAMLDKQHSEKQIERVAEVIAMLTRDGSMSWLNEYTDRIQAQWKSYYIVPENRNKEQFHQDVERVERELKHAVNEWQTIEETRQSYLQQLQSLETNTHGLGDLLSVDDHKVEIQEEITKVARKLRDARRHILQIIAPRDEEFDPSRDYNHESDDTGIFKIDHRHDNLDQESDEYLDRKSGKEVAGTTDGPAESNNGSWQTAASANLLTEGENENIENETTSELPNAGIDAASTNRTSTTDKSQSNRSSSSTIISSAGAERTDDMVIMEPDGKVDRKDTAAVAMFWRAIHSDRPGIAYYIAKFAPGQDNDKKTMPQANLIAASVLANHVQSADGEVVTALRPLLESVETERLSRNDCQNKDAVNLLLFCATLRPALFAQSTGAASMLRCISVPEILAPVYKLAITVADHADRLQGVRLDASLIRATLRGDWEDEFTTFVARVSDWRNRAKSQRIIFHRANRVWQDLFNENGRLAELIALISKDDTTSSDRIDAIRKQISNQKTFNAFVQKSDPKHRKSNPIQGSALKQLWDHVQPAIELSSEWLRLMDVKPDPKGFIAGRIGTLRRDLALHGDEAIAAIDHVMVKGPSIALSATLKRARSTIETLLNIFNGDAAPSKVIEASPDVIRSRDLLFVTGLDLDTGYRPTTHHNTNDILELLLDTRNHVKTLPDAFKMRLSRGDLTGAQLACEAMDVEENLEANRCRASLDQEVERQRRKLKKNYTAEEGRLERAFCRGQLKIEERDNLAARLVSLKRLVQSNSSDGSSPNAVDAITSAKLELDRVQQLIQTSSTTRINETNNRFKALISDNPETTNYSIINQAIDSGDILTANELISRIDKGESIDLPEIMDDVFAKFTSSLEEIDRAIEAPERLQPKVVFRHIANRKHIAGVNFENLSEEEAAHATNLLETWYTLSKTKRADKHVLQSLLQQLGFNVREINYRSQRLQADLVTDPIEDRAICPSRQFGSEARGHYRILLNWKRPASESIADSLGVKGGASTLVLHFGCLGADREKLRKLAIQTHRVFLTIDESLILFLTGHPPGRLSTLFRCTLPFTSIDPYATTSSLVPPELFYGRTREQLEITELSGSCFIYGGRQLGKTALLRRVERDFNRSQKSNIAKWIDLKVNEIGYARRPHDIWPLLQWELQNLDIVRKRHSELDPEDRRHLKSLLDQIQQWINKREDHRLLLLLDEADAFLEQDARMEFRESSRLKGLMDATERRFKVVFAGLHNVLRTTRQANHPLAHFGEPIQVGAMLSNGEWRQAQALVREPLQTVGCQFESDELSTRILAQTNYFPSLIQLYGAELVRRLRDSTKTFPYVIGDDDINTTYSSQDLNTAIRERFLLTLQLDQRYEVIAYALTQEINNDADLGQGLNRDEIANVAKAWWPEGFRMTDVEFGMLLHEMEGLGVLRSLDQGRRYTLRNPNILLLLGNNDDIEKILSKERQPPTVYEPAAFRARYPKNRQSSKRRGPLTYQQESALRTEGGVTVISGCDVAGLGNVAEFLQQRIEPDLFKVLRLVSDFKEFEQELRELRPLRNMINVYIVPLTTNWSTHWVAAAKRVPWSRIVFTATPEILWEMAMKKSDMEDIDWIQIGPWDKRFLRHWLEDINLTADAEHVNELMEVSGGWPAAIDKFGKKPPHKSWSTRIDELNLELNNDLAMSDFGIYSEEVQRILQALLSEEAFDLDSIEIASNEIGLDNTEILQRVKWSECLKLVSSAGDSLWTFNPLIRRLLEASDPAR